jgi:Ca-activated chloride channel homolog
LKKFNTFILFFFSFYCVNAQLSEPYKPQTTRVLIVLDGSGSMKESWGNSNRWETAKELLFKAIDSIQRANKNVEFGIRIFGHQSKHAEKNCKDSKLEVPFGKLNAKYIREILHNTTPQGWTPIAYSLEQAAGDFPSSGTSAHNAIILITDGLETCNGDICQAGKALQEKRITLRPYVIGLGLAQNEKNFFDCVGKFFDVVDAPQFREVLNATISQSINPTTAQINLLNAHGKPVETDVELTIYDHFTKKMLYNFVHALNAQGLPDTLKLDPKGKYDIEVHAIPSVRKNEIELTAGIHNIIPVDVPRGTIKITTPQKSNVNIQAIVKQHATGETIYVQDVNLTMKYLTGVYDVEVLTLPKLVSKNIDLGYGSTKEISVPVPGTLLINSMTTGVGSIYIEQNGVMERIIEFRPMKMKESVQLLPGKYVFVYRQSNVTEALYTKMQNFEINSGFTTTLRF